MAEDPKNDPVQAKAKKTPGVTTRSEEPGTTGDKQPGERRGKDAKDSRS